ncbi:hypothetical protein [Moraxella marmotae]|uniref:hypothetical protein n=1 Tax=Moraxella marmotae TaxID=3344520 RepID=UPI0035F2577C
MYPDLPMYISIPFKWLKDAQLPAFIADVYERNKTSITKLSNGDKEQNCYWLSYNTTTDIMACYPDICENYVNDHLCSSPDEFVEKVLMYKTNRLLNINQTDTK